MGLHLRMMRLLFENAVYNGMVYSRFLNTLFTLTITLVCPSPVVMRDFTSASDHYGDDDDDDNVDDDDDHDNVDDAVDDD